MAERIIVIRFKKDPDEQKMKVSEVGLDKTGRFWRASLGKMK